MSTPARPDLPPAWHRDLQARLDRPPAQPRLPLHWRGQPVGSVEPAWAAALLRARPEAAALLHVDAGTAALQGHDLDTTFARLAVAMRAAGLAGRWRDELLAVRGAGGAVLGRVERAAVRPLGIATHAVHLAGLAPDGRHWLQQRSLDKATDPGRWDTLVGGMVPAADTLQAALARETWEEAGLRLEALQGLAHGGRLVQRGPAAEVAGGYVVEEVDWFRAVVPAGVSPVNQDGEVLRFELADAPALARRLQDGDCTLEAAAVLAALLACPH